jgi:hypothetical protein
MSISSDIFVDQFSKVQPGTMAGGVTIGLLTMVALDQCDSSRRMSGHRKAAASLR